ncbi:MAG: hypothetical protein AAGN35_22070 [Bacteroidota bacterium]
MSRIQGDLDLIKADVAANLSASDDVIAVINVAKASAEHWSTHNPDGSPISASMSNGNLTPQGRRILDADAEAGVQGAIGGISGGPWGAVVGAITGTVIGSAWEAIFY